ncbi:MAG: ABC transporter ATP-binding protein, partial [Spirochaetes bacterium]|nr:ABC transporter ATP-binding protein [Spirochaetota bacterium]
MDAILEIKDLKKYFPEVKAVDGISFAIEPGTCFGLLGPNGAGKTTAIEVIEGILHPTGGEIYYKGKQRGQSFKNEVGIQFQDTELPQFLTVMETLQMFRNLYDHRAELDYLIETCRLEEIIDRDNRKISGGQKQRLLLAMALANDPELIFLDEPTTGLDPQARRHLWDIVRRIKSMKRTLILTTHYMEEAEILCDVIGIIDHGKIIAMGPPKGLLKEHCGGVTISIKDDIDDAVLNHFPCRWFRTPDHIQIQTDSPNDCLYRMVK